VDITDLIIAQKYESIIKYYDSLAIHYYSLASQKREERINEIYEANGLEYDKDSPFNDFVLFDSPVRKKLWRLENATYEIDYMNRLKKAKQVRAIQVEDLLREIEFGYDRAHRGKYESFIEEPYRTDSITKELGEHFEEDFNHIILEYDE
jgi:hypothetical protein